MKIILIFIIFILNFNESKEIKRDDFLDDKLE